MQPAVYTCSSNHSVSTKYVASVFHQFVRFTLVALVPFPTITPSPFSPILVTGVHTQHLTGRATHQAKHYSSTLSSRSLPCLPLSHGDRRAFAASN